MLLCGCNDPGLVLQGAPAPYSLPSGAPPSLQPLQPSMSSFSQVKLDQLHVNWPMGGWRGDIARAVWQHDQQHISKCAPCHLTVDPSIDPTLAWPALTHACEACRFPDGTSSKLLCDNCSGGWHMACLEPPMKDALEGMWLCLHCIKAVV
jgi:hypothetical protein